MTFPPEVWDGVLRALSAELPPFALESWLGPLVVEPAVRGVRLLSPSLFHRNRVRDQLGQRIRSLLRDALGEAIELELEVGGSNDSRARARARTQAIAKEFAAANTVSAQPVHGPRSVRRAACAGPAPHPAERTAGQLARGATQPARAVQRSFDQSFDNFVVGPSNALAREVSLAIATARHRELRQLYLCSGPGLGKTHLARAACSEAARRERVRYLTAEAFTNDFMAAVRSNGMPAFKERYRAQCDLLVVDDVPFLAGKAGTQLEFFHTVGHLIDRGGRVILTGDRPPGGLTELDPQVQSQVSGGFVVTIEPPDAELRRGVLRQKASAGGIRIPEDCLDALVESLPSSLRELDGALVQLVTTASLLKRPIDLALTREVLTAKGALAHADAAAPTPELVIEVVASFFKTTPASMCSRSRRRDVLVPRQLAMYLCRRFTDASLAEIGRLLGRDHAAVRNAIKRVEQNVTERAKHRYQLEALSERVRDRLGR